MGLIDASWYHKPPGIRVDITAGGVIVRLEAGRVYLALVREAAYATYILPKGRAEAGESLESAARREIEEEAGLANLELLADLGVQERLSFNKKAWKVIHYYLFRARQVEGKPTDRLHDYRCEWFPLEALPEFFWPEQRRLVEDNRQRILGLLTSHP